MKCVILGAGGQLGGEWIEQVTKRSDETYFGLTIKSFGSAEADITDNTKINHLLDSNAPDVVINCAAYTKVDEAETERELAEQVNSLAVKNLAESCKKRGIKLVHYSTDYVFAGREEDKMKFPEGYPEDHYVDPVNWYGTTKRGGEEAILQSGAEHLIIRTSWLCGQFGSNFITTMLSLAQKHDHLDVVDDQWGSPSFTENLVYNSVKLLQQNEQGIFHLTSKGMITWHDLAKENIQANW
ncbi:MAG: dTDP-4-dehydrorhamnose reductase [Balneolaceae bacterium]|nr:dTDP-4-dehydrorhamnose reductase [Balneolaceae bacterium]